MAKRSKTKSKTTLGVQYDLPGGYEERSEDIVAFLNVDQEPVHFTPRGVKAIDGPSEPQKSAFIIYGDYIGGPCLDDAGLPVTPKEGARVGLWYRPGMRAIAGQSDVDCFIYLKGERDTGKVNTMKLYSVSTRVRGGPLLLTEDLRKQSKDQPSPFRKEE